MDVLRSLAALEQWPPVRALATSEWGYPLVSTLHLFGIALLIGGILSVDLRLLGVWRGGFDALAIDRLRRIAAAGLALAILTGAALFSVRGSEYIENPWLLGKWAFVAVGVVNAVAFGRRQRRGMVDWDGGAARLAGGLSLLCWLGALVCGRWIAFA